jgi:hypothetical protein
VEFMPLGPISPASLDILECAAQGHFATIDQAGRPQAAPHLNRPIAEHGLHWPDDAPEPTVNHAPEAPLDGSMKKSSS